MKTPFFFFTGAALLAAFGCQGQSASDLQKKYTVVNRTITAGTEPGSVHLDERQDDGIAWLKGGQFTNGIIEVDIKGRDKLQASFVGIAFHGLNDSTYEAVYFRPFNFRASDPVRKLHAVQYMALPKFDWQKLRNEFPGKYEQPVSPAPDPNEWFHARITVDGKIVKVYVNGSAAPSLVIEPLVHTDGTMIGLWAGTATDGDWKNLKLISDR